MARSISRKEVITFRGEVDLQKKRSLPLQHLHTIALLQASSTRNRVLWHEEKFIKNFRIVSRAALKGSEGRDFDTPDIAWKVALFKWHLILSLLLLYLETFKVADISPESNHIVRGDILAHTNGCCGYPSYFLGWRHGVKQLFRFMPLT